ncbi:MAG: ribosome maturation factor RimP [Endomicrobium sp.]|jgi:ribosome maturation factor RimP|nr:ribosome maturation factor RimP [Endomicrobium sp.]
MKKLQKIKEILEIAAKEEKIEIIDVECVNENKNKILKVFIDKHVPITIKDCEKMSYIFNKILDKNDILNYHYILEVSSPGCNRVLKKKEHFMKCIGSNVRINVIEAINNQKRFFGKLLYLKNDFLIINDVNNGIIKIEFLNVKKANVEDINNGL